ncbi:MAG: nicotinamide-nucleotide amidohydrolase family protein [Planctomycetota bacterium]|nr:nicotinamide-nucleotide amidohydrolase family protein [Planctomycetota bacterium]
MSKAHRQTEAVGSANTPEGGGPGLVEIVLELLKARRERLAVVESCTGGLLGAMLTAIPGSSAVFAGGWITYTNAMKVAEVGVPGELFPDAARPAADPPGAVSAQVARAMALGGLEHARFGFATGEGVEHCLAVTGIAGPDGGTESKPVGTVWICRASRETEDRGAHLADCRRFRFPGDRDSVREHAATTALAMLRQALTGVEAALPHQQEPTSESSPEPGTSPKT